MKGYYRDAGLDVKILPGAASSAVLQRVARNQVAFGVENADRILMGRAQQADVIALLAPIQKSPRGIMVHADSGFTKIADIADVTLAVNSGAPWVAYLKARAPLTNVRFVPYPGSVAQFLVDRKYAQQAYVFSEPYVAREKGADARCLLVADLGFNPYTSVLFTNAETLATRPEVVGKFVSASLKGWQTYLERPEETNRYLHEVNPEMTTGSLEYGVQALRPLCLDGLPGPAAIGLMTLERWQTLAGQLVEVGGAQGGCRRSTGGVHHEIPAAVAVRAANEPASRDRVRLLAHSRHIAGEAAGRRDVRVTDVIHHHPVRVKSPTECADGPLHPRDPLLR